MKITSSIRLACSATFWQLYSQDMKMKKDGPTKSTHHFEVNDEMRKFFLHCTHIGLNSGNLTFDQSNVGFGLFGHGIVESSYDGRIVWLQTVIC
jgi:hypothetical protein